MLAASLSAFALTAAPIESVRSNERGIIESLRMSADQLLWPDRLFHLAAPLAGVWTLDAHESESLSGFLRACGVPRVVAPVLARKFDGDLLMIDVADGAVGVSTPRSGWELPIKLQTDAVYAPGHDVTIETPRGPQRGRLREPTQLRAPSRGSAPPLLQLERHGPSDGELVVESYAIVEAAEAAAGPAPGSSPSVLEQVVTHIEPGGAEVTAVRVWRRKEVLNS